jgi:hypothetical protein
MNPMASKRAARKQAGLLGFLQHRKAAELCAKQDAGCSM